MKPTGRILSLFIAAVMAATQFPYLAFAASLEGDTQDNNQVLATSESAQIATTEDAQSAQQYSAASSAGMMARRADVYQATSIYSNDPLPAVAVDFSNWQDTVDDRDIQIYDNVILIKGETSRKYAVVKTDGTKLADFQYDSFKFAQSEEYGGRSIEDQTFYAFGHPYYQLMLLEQGNLMYPLNTVSGKICAQGFTNVENLVNGLAIVEYNGAYGVINSNGDIVLAPEYTHISVSEGIIRAQNEGSAYYFNSEGGDITPGDYTARLDFSDGLGAVTDKTTGKIGFIDKSGKIVIEPLYNKVGFDIIGPKTVGFINGYTLATTDTQVAFVDTYGIEYDFSNKIADIVTRSGDTLGEQDINKLLDGFSISWPVKDQVLVEYEPTPPQEKKYYLCGITTNEIIEVSGITEVMLDPAQSKDVLPVMTEQGPNFVQPDGTLQITDNRFAGCNIRPVTFSDVNLREPVRAKYLTGLMDGIDGLYRVLDDSDSLQGLYNAVTDTYLELEDFQLCANGIILTKNGKTGFYDYQLKEILPFEYDAISNFAYLGKQQKSTSDALQYIQAEKDGTHTLFTADGEAKFSAEQELMWMDYDRFSDTLSTYPYKTAIYKSDGAKIIEIGTDTAAGYVTETYCNGVLVASQNEKYGAFDINGNLIVPMEYDDLTQFDTGYAIGKKSGDSSSSQPDVVDVLNTKGEIVYTESTPFLGTLTIVASANYAVCSGLSEFKIVTLPEADTAPVGGIVLDDSQLTLYVGDKSRLAASTDPLGAAVTWESDNPDIAKVDNEGLVTCVSEGTATITASITINQDIYTASCSITVKNHIKFNDKSISLSINKSRKLDLKLDPAGMSVTWKSSAPDIVSVDGNGVVTGLAEGTVTVTATVVVDSIKHSDSCTVSVSPYLDISPYFKDFSDFTLGVKVLDKWPNNSSSEDNRELLLSLLRNESVSQEVEDRLYDLLFKAQYRPDALGGNNTKYPFQNEGPKGTYLEDKGLGKTIKFNNSSAGCMHYANAAMVYVYGKHTENTVQGSIDKEKDPLDGRNAIGGAQNVKMYLKRAVPGSHVRFNYIKETGAKGVHSVVFLGRDDADQGFYYISFLGGPTSQKQKMYVGYTTYAKIAESATYLDVRSVSNSPNQEYLKKIKVAAHCPIDIRVAYGEEVLDSASNQLSASFGTMSIQQVDGERSISFEIDYGHDYDIAIIGTGTGDMDLTIEFLDENGKTFGHVREFVAVPITAQTKGLLSKMDVEVPTELILYEGEKFKEVWAAADEEIIDGPNPYYTNLYQSQLPPETQEPEPPGEKPNPSQPNQNQPSSGNESKPDNSDNKNDENNTKAENSESTIAVTATESGGAAIRGSGTSTGTSGIAGSGNEQPAVTDDKETSSHASEQQESPTEPTPSVEDKDASDASNNQNEPGIKEEEMMDQAASDGRTLVILWGVGIFVVLLFGGSFILYRRNRR